MLYVRLELADQGEATDAKCCDTRLAESRVRATGHHDSCTYMMHLSAVTKREGRNASSERWARNAFPERLERAGSKLVSRAASIAGEFRPSRASSRSFSHSKMQGRDKKGEQEFPSLRKGCVQAEA